MVEQFHGKEEVIGSTPIVSTIFYLGFNMIKLLFFVAFIVVGLFANENTKSVKFYTFNNDELILEFLHLKQKNEKLKGLMYKDKVEPFDGLIFEFNENEIASIWMKNMKISIDIIFVSKEGKILSIIEHAKPCIQKDCTVYTTLNAKYVIETSSGFISSSGIDFYKNISIED